MVINRGLKLRNYSFYSLGLSEKRGLSLGAVLGGDNFEGAGLREPLMASPNRNRKNSSTQVRAAGSCHSNVPKFFFYRPGIGAEFLSGILIRR